MKSKFIVLITIILTSCFPTRKMTLCKCTILYNVSTNLNLKEIYINKYYNLDAKDTLYEPIILYKNGVALQPGVTRHVNELSSFKVFKSSWGCYEAKNKKINIQKFYESGGGTFGVREKSGLIINDSTFILMNNYGITSETSNSKNIDTFSLYHLPKPDSINWLIRKKCQLRNKISYTLLIIFS